ncbi:MAG TPA: lipase [Lachnospiraceae bacterium]|nr:lipase [Lachnospiraceae bacterium]
MKKVLRVIGSLFLLIVIFIVGFLIWNSKRQLVSKNYYKEIETGGDIEAKYLGVGPYRDVQLKEIAVMQNFKKYLIYYPTDITRINKKFPLIICSNGTGVPASKCRALLKRMATWGFIVVGTDEEYSWNGFSSEMCLKLMIKLNDAEVVFDWSSNPFYQSVDLENIGLMGHSQGGVGVINAATAAKHADMVKAIVVMSPANMEISSALEWDYNPSLITVPTFLVSGTGQVDENIIISLSQLNDIYNEIPENVDKVMIRKTGVDHGETSFAEDGYITAWFMWHLQEDEYAARAFLGEHPEIQLNRLYQDQRINIK